MSRTIYMVTLDNDGNESSRAAVHVKYDEHGYTLSCAKGLWSVSAPSSDRAHKEAVHYYRQYASDGEYDD